MKISKVFFLVLSAAFIIAAANISKADDVPAPVNINFQVEGPTSSIYNQSVIVPACTTPNNATSTVNGFCAFAAAGLTADVSWSSFGGLVNSINGVSGDSSNFWLWFLNGEPAPVGIDSYILQPNDKVLWALGREPLKVSFSTLTPKVNATSTITVLGFDPNSFSFLPLAGAHINGTDLITGTNGTADIVPTSTAPFTVSVSKDGFLPSDNFTITPKPETVKVIVRDLTSTVFSGEVDMPGQNAPSVMVTPTSGTTSPVAVSPNSVLGILENLQNSTTAFKITDLAYYSSFNSFLVNCVSIPADSSAPECYSWTYAVNTNFPQVGIDQTQVKANDTVYFFFGSTHKTALSKTTVQSGETFTATAQKYDLPTGAYVPLTGVTLGVGNFQPDFSFLETATATVDSLSQASFAINATGTMEVGIKEDFYFPTTKITVTEAVPTPTPTQTPGGSSGGSSPASFNVPSALNFLSQQQNADGSFSSDIVTDWTAIAFASQDPGAAKIKLKNYLLNYKYKPSSITDYERHAMALQALNINPYSDTGTDYITPIANSFDGTQIGDTSLDTDDIFAIFPLSRAGFAANDPIIKKEIAYIIFKQKPNGSWDDSPDVTAAAIMAIGPYFQTPGYVAATGKAMGYLASKQNADGGFGNIDSTSWVLTMLNAVKAADPVHFVPLVSSNGKKPEDYLASAQNPDGGVTSPLRVWSTAYAVTAATGKDWLVVLNSFSKPTTSDSQNGSTRGGNSGSGGSTDGSVLGTSTLATLPITTPTSTPATTTPETTPTTTPPVIIKIDQNLLVAKSEVKPTVKKFVTKTKPALKPQFALEPTPTPTIDIPKEQPTPKKPNWFIRVLDSIGSFFQNLF